MTTIIDSLDVGSFTRGAGLHVRIAARVATTTSLPLSGNLNGAVVDGVTLAVGDRVLVRAQATVAQSFTVTTIADVAGSTQSKYFLFSTPSADYYVWNNVGGAGVDPAVSGRVGIAVAYALSASANAIATAITVGINGVLTGVAVASTNVVTFTLAAGYAQAPTIGNAGWAVGAIVAGVGAIDHGIWIVQSGAGASYRSGDLLVGDNANSVRVDVQEGVQFAQCEFGQSNKPSVVGTNALAWVMRQNFLYPANSISYADSANTRSNIPTAANSVLVTGAGGVPTMSNTLPSGTLITGTPTLANQIVNKSYVDSIATGLDPKESVRVRTKANIGGTYSAVGGTSGSGGFTGVDLTSTTNFDLGAVTLVAPNRVLIMNQTDNKQNGIYRVVTAGIAGVLERAPDQDGTPAIEVSSGNYTFIETGGLYGSTGWVLQGDGVLTLNTDAMIWTQFSAAQSFNALNGITISGSNIGTNALTNGGLIYNAGALQVDFGASATTGVVPASRGGTGQITYASNDLLVGNAGALSKLSSVAQRIMTTDITGAVGWRNDGYLNNIRGPSALEPILMTFNNTNAGVNYLGVSNALTTAAPILNATGTDTNINLRLNPKGTGAVEIVGSSGGEIRLWDPTTSFYAGLKAGAMAANKTWTLPLVDGANGDVLRTNGSAVLSFVSPTATQRAILPWVYNQLAASGSALTAVAYFTWTQAEYSTIGSGKVMYNCTIPGGKVLEVQVWNATTSTQLALDSRSVDGFYTFTFTLPTANAQLQLRIRKTVGGGANPTISGVNMVFNPVS